MPVFLSFFPKNRHFETGSNCDVLTLKRTSFSTFFVVGRSNHLPTTSAFFRQIPSVSIYTKKLEINLAAMPRGFESHRLRQKQHPAGRCFLFLRQTMQGLQGEIRTACARRFASRRAKMPRWGIFRARESPRVCAKSSTLRGAAYYFCGKLCKGCKVGFEQPVPGALRPAGLQQSCGLLQGRGRIPPPAPSITTQFHIG